MEVKRKFKELVICIIKEKEIWYNKYFKYMRNYYKEVLHQGHYNFEQN